VWFTLAVLRSECGSAFRLVAPVLAVLVGLVAGCSADQGEAFDVAVAATVEALQAEVPTAEPTVVAPVAKWDYSGQLDAQEEAGASPSWRDQTRDRLDLAMGGGVAAWQAEKEEVSKLIEDITALREGQANFADDYADAVKYGGVESFLIGTTNRDGLLKEKIARYNEIQSDGLDPRAWVANILAQAGLDPRDMDEWTPEQVESQMARAVGVIEGVLPHPDDEP
jgi:hypothetical protein